LISKARRCVARESFAFAHVAIDRFDGRSGASRIALLVAPVALVEARHESRAARFVRILDFQQGIHPVAPFNALLPAKIAKVVESAKNLGKAQQLVLERRVSGAHRLCGDCGCQEQGRCSASQLSDHDCAVLISAASCRAISSTEPASGSCSISSTVTQTAASASSPATTVPPA